MGSSIQVGFFEAAGKAESGKHLREKIEQIKFGTADRCN